MEKEFIPYQESVELKELGFDIPSISGYSYSDSDKLLTQAILYQQGFRWFREKHGLYSVIDGLEGRQYYKITQLNSYSKEYNTYEEAELACLRKLIEIVKQKI